MTEYATRTGTVRIGQLYRDAKRAEPRTVRVEAIAAPRVDYRGKKRCEITIAVLDAAGAVRKTLPIDAARLTGSNYVRVGQ
ncbi:hypothetical protein AB0C65_38220 [Nocardia sp. NPDC048505]|uniref:hypothetical protein n=1 Tax=Nocardia sp. NPDC048505 TaxID=3155756 RepID=UPI0033F3FD8C